MLRVAFWAVSLATYFAVGWLKKLALEGKFPVQLNLPGSAYSAPVRRLLGSTMALWLCEVPSCLALLLLFATWQPLDFYPLLLMAVVIGVLHFPRYQQWEEWLTTQADGFR